MESSRIKKIAVNLIKIGFTALAIWYVLSKIDVNLLLVALKSCSVPLLLLALLFFIVSKIVSAVRLNIFFRDIDVKMPGHSNLKLYLLGMFYNLFLPGGIGGDGYKVWLLHKEGDYSVKRLTAAVLLDRANGMYAIVLLTFLVALFMPFFGTYRFLLPLIAAISLVAYRFCIAKLFKSFRRSIYSTTLLSFCVQLLQVISILIISQAIGINASYLALILIFMVSSAVAVLPFTIGGVGARELVFLYGSLWWGIDSSQAVAVSFIFFAITAIVSLGGIYFVFSKIDLKLVKQDIND